jgi:hypothetical protein
MLHIAMTMMRIAFERRDQSELAISGTPSTASIREPRPCGVSQLSQ